MKSQLEHLQDLLQKPRSQNQKLSRSIAIASGKGGVGKSSISLSLATAFAQMNLKVLLVDGDPGLADLNIMMGVHPQWHWGHFLENQVSFEQIINKTPFGFDFIHGFSGMSSTQWVQKEAMSRILTSLNQIKNEYDYVMIDVGAGLSDSTLAFTTSVDQVILIMNGELTSLADAYGTIKTIRKWHPGQAIEILVNSAKGEAEAKVAHKSLSQVTQQFLAMEAPYLTWLPYEPLVSRALLEQKPVLSIYPGAEWSVRLKELAQTLLVR